MIPCQKPKMVSFASSIKKKLLFVLLDLQPFSKYSKTFGYFTKFSFHPKWNDVQLLFINMEYTSCLTSCQTASDLRICGNYKISGNCIKVIEW